MQYLLTTEAIMVILSPFWSIAYFWFPRAAKFLAGVLAERGAPELADNLVGVGRFVKACAWSHLNMSLMGLCMIIGMVFAPAAYLVSGIRLLILVQYGAGAFVSLRVVRKFWADCGLGEPTLRDAVEEAFTK